MDYGLHCRCTFTRDGQDQLEDWATEATIQEMAVTGALASKRIGGSQDRKIGQLRMSNWTIQFPRRHQHPLVSNISSGCLKSYLLPMDQGVLKTRQG
jgi:hypothetical protein